MEIGAGIEARKGSVEVTARDQLSPNREVKSLKLAGFASVNCVRVFTIAGISTDFLDNDPADWPQDASYQQALDVVKHITLIG